MRLLSLNLNILMHNVPKWSDTLLKSCTICCKIFKVCLTILGFYALKAKDQQFPVTLWLMYSPEAVAYLKNPEYGGRK